MVTARQREGTRLYRVPWDLPAFLALPCEEFTGTKAEAEEAVRAGLRAVAEGAREEKRR